MGVHVARQLHRIQQLPFLDEVASLLGDLLPDGGMIDESFEWLE
jgi:hypothetical protein